MKVRKILSAILVVVLMLTLLGCSSAGEAMTDSFVSNGFYSDMQMSSDKLYEEVEVPNSTVANDGNSESGSTPEGRKWIITVNLEAETDDLDTLLAQLEQKVSAMNGYMEDQRIYNGSAYSGRRYRNASLTVRVPAAQVDAFTDQIAGISNIISKNRTMDDVTLSYVATESRMKALQVEEERLLELMGKAENMSDLLEIEARLTDVRYELERVTSQLRVYDNLVDYATIHLSIDEVQEYTPVEEETLWQRISGGFMSSLKGVGNFFVELFVALIVGLPYIILIGGIAAIIVILCRRSAKKRRERNAQQRPYPQQPYIPPQNPPENQ